ncbi:MAG TPA: hypothetical protein VN108_03320 [Marmoricola sp.]|nr:hypothetical protein [Marmoricola sp.]
MKRPIVLASAIAATAFLTLTACGNAANGKEASITASPISPSQILPRPSGAVINVSITKSVATSDHSTLAVKVNEPVTLFINAAAAGELHVHSTPEKHIVFPVGLSKVTLTFDVPGTVVIEDHALDKQVTQVQVN